MPIKPVKPVSDRGNIKNLNQDLSENPISNPPIPFELRLAELYERAERDKNVALMESTGFIVMNHPGDRSAYPVTLIRHREKVNAICVARKESIKELSEELAPVFAAIGELPAEIRMAQYKKANALYAILDTPGITKTASAYGMNRRSFRRVQ